MTMSHQDITITLVLPWSLCTLLAYRFLQIPVGTACEVLPILYPNWTTSPQTHSSPSKSHFLWSGLSSPPSFEDDNVHVWTGRTDGLREEWKKPSISSWNSLPFTEEKAIVSNCLTHRMEFWNPNWWVGRSLTRRLGAGFCTLCPLS